MSINATYPLTFNETILGNLYNSNLKYMISESPFLIHVQTSFSVNAILTQGNNFYLYLTHKLGSTKASMYAYYGNNVTQCILNSTQVDNVQLEIASITSNEFYFVMNLYEFSGVCPNISMLMFFNVCSL